MKKMLSGLLLAGVLSVGAQADFVRVEMGGGIWNQSVEGDIQYTGETAFSTNILNYGDESKSYLWAFIKHPVPVIPNIRLEYAAVAFEGITTESFTYNGKGFSGSTASRLTMDQFDVILYYNILDNTAWTTFDLGVDIKSMDGELKAVSQPSGVNISESESIVVPMAYGRMRIEIPGTDIGIEGEAKYLQFKDSTISDASIKIDYTLVDMIPFVDLGLEVGYRTQSIDIDASDIDDIDTSLKLDVDGVFFGVVGRF